MSAQKVRIYDHPNPQLKSFLTSLEICAYRVEHFKRPLDRGSEKALEQIGAIGAQVVRDLMALPGVHEVSIKPKEVRIKKGTAYSWGDIQERALEILLRALRRKELRIVRGRVPLRTENDPKGSDSRGGAE
jgi:hypothetical protein